MTNPTKHGATLAVTLRSAIQWVLNHRWDKDGCVCPCCGRLNKVYERTVSNQMVKNLARLHWLTAREDRSYHHSQFMRAGQGWDFTKLSSLGLVAQPENTDERKRTSGHWVITPKGKAFVQGRVRIPKKMVFYHDVLLETSDEKGSIQDFWPDFNYRELMEAVA